MFFETPLGLQQMLQAYCGRDFKVRKGVAEGATLSGCLDLFCDDIYQLSPQAPLEALSFFAHPSGSFVLSEKSYWGKSGNILTLDCSLNFMSEKGHRFEALVFIERSAEGHEQSYLIPQSKILPLEPYRLLHIEVKKARQVLRDTPLLLFPEGTLLTDDRGRLRRIESFEPDECLITLGHSPSTILSISTNADELNSSLAFVDVPLGTVGNDTPLLLGPTQRLHHLAQSGKKAHKNRPLSARDFMGQNHNLSSSPRAVKMYQLLVTNPAPVVRGDYAMDATFIDLLPPPNANTDGSFLTENQESKYGS